MAEKKAGSGQGVYKRGKTWTIVVYVPDPETGKKKQKWIGGFKTKQEALRAKRQKQTEIDNMEVSSWGDLPFSEYAKKFLDWKRPQVSAVTIRMYERYLRIYGRFLTKPMLKITVDDIRTVDNEMRQDGLSDVTRSAYHGFFSSVFNWAIDNDDIPKSPYRRFTIGRPKRRESTTPDEEQVRYLLEKSEGHWLHLPILLAVTGGLRAGEVMGLKFSDFDFEENVVSIVRQIVKIPKEGEELPEVRVQKPKTRDSIRRVALPKITMDAVHEAYEKRGSDGWLFPNRDGNYQPPTKLYTDFCRFRTDLMLIGHLDTKIRFHDLRHAYASLSLNHGVPLKLISNALGHTDIQITANVYCDLENPNRESARVMEILLAGCL